ncbi:MAG: GLPGLI family protein, partial [Bacteroidota bacterium]
TIKMDFDVDLPEGVDMAGMFPESTSMNKELLFNADKSVYIDAKGNESTDQEYTNDDGTFQIVIKMNEDEEIYYSDYSSKEQIHQTGFMGKSFIISDELKKPKWKMTGEKIKYMGYECLKAEMIVPAEEEDEEDKLVVAWFTPAIKAQVGPRSYHSLPGAILMLSIDGDKHEIKATEVNFDIDPSDKIVKPKKGKKVTQDEYIKIVEEKTKEMMELNGGAFQIQH